MQKQTERLQKILSAHGVASRREAEKMILAGRVSVNGIPAEIGQSVQHGVDLITVDNVPIPDINEHVYLMLNKPRGYITTASDDLGRKTVMDLVASIGVKIYPVGRLDMNSEGLLLFTNDGDFANRVMHPSNEKHKVYDVAVSGDIDTGVQKLRLPLEIDDHTVTAVNVNVLKIGDTGGIIRITIAEGRNRQIRKMCTSCNLNVKTLKRISIGKITLGSLKTGKWRHLTKEEVQSFG